MTTMDTDEQKSDYHRFLGLKVWAHALYGTMLQRLPQGQYDLENFKGLRREGNYAKRQYFRKKTVKGHRLHWQSGDIPRSLFKLSTEYCGGRKQSKAIKSQAPALFKSEWRVSAS